MLFACSLSSLRRVRRKWKIPRVVLRVKIPAAPPPRLASNRAPRTNPRARVFAAHPRLSLLTHSLHRVNSAFQLCIKQQQSLFRHVSLCVFLFGFSLCMAFCFLPQPLQVSFPLLRHPQPPPFAPKRTDYQTFALSISEYSGFLVFSGPTKSPKRPWL